MQNIKLDSSQIKDFSQIGFLSGLTYTDSGDLKISSMIQIIWEKVKGCFNFTDHSNKKLVAFHSLRMLQNSTPENLQQDIQTVSKFAAKAHLISSGDSIKTVEELVSKVSFKLLKTDSPKSLESLTEAYRIHLVDSKLLKEGSFAPITNIFSPSVETPVDIENPETVEDIQAADSFSLSNIAKVSLVATALIGLGSLLYLSAGQSTPDIDRGFCPASAPEKMPWEEALPQLGSTDLTDNSTAVVLYEPTSPNPSFTKRLCSYVFPHDQSRHEKPTTFFGSIVGKITNLVETTFRLAPASKEQAAIAPAPKAQPAIGWKPLSRTLTFENGSPLPVITREDGVKTILDVPNSNGDRCFPMSDLTQNETNQALYDQWKKTDLGQSFKQLTVGDRYCLIDATIFKQNSEFDTPDEKPADDDSKTSTLTERVLSVASVIGGAVLMGLSHGMQAPGLLHGKR